MQDYCMIFKFPTPPEYVIEEARKTALEMNEVDTNEVPLDMTVVSFYKWFMLPEASQTWLNDNVMNGDWGVQIIYDSTPIHKDKHCSGRFLFNIDTGDATTSFYSDSKALISSMHLLPMTWYHLKTDCYHEVTNVTGLRIAITCKTHPKNVE